MYWENYLWCQQLPKLGQQRSRRPGSVRPASVPSAFQQVISPGRVRGRTRAGTCPREDQRKPHHLDVSAHLQTGLTSDQRGSPPGCFSHPACSWTGRGIHDCGSCVLLCQSPAPCSAMLRDREPLHLAHAFYSIAKGSWCQAIGTEIHRPKTSLHFDPDLYTSIHAGKVLRLIRLIVL